MKLAVAAIGLLKAGPEREMAAEYEKRIQGIGRQAGLQGLLVQDWAESRATSADQRKLDEAKLLWSAVPDGGTAVLLDERGDSLTSQAFAKFIEAEAQRGARQMTFMIGGPDGHALTSRSKAQKCLCLGTMTWPHRLARVMLMEQIYRAITINVNHPYHRA